MENMEIINAIVQSIATVGFPAAMCLAVCYFLYKEMNLHKEEVLELKECISRNNEILAQLKQLIEDKISK